MRKSPRSHVRSRSLFPAVCHEPCALTTVSDNSRNSIARSRLLIMPRNGVDPVSLEVKMGGMAKLLIDFRAQRVRAWSCFSPDIQTRHHAPAFF